MDSVGSHSPDIEKILEKLSQLEERLRVVEERLAESERGPSDSREGSTRSAEPSRIPVGQASGSELSLEYKIGEYWLAQVGTVVLLLGIAFLLSYPFQNVPAIFISVLGYVSVAAIFALSIYWRKNFQYLSRILFAGGAFLLYFTTLRLHFFSANPVIHSKAAGLFALIVVLLVLLYLANRRQSEGLAGLVLFLFFSTALIAETPHFTLTTFAASALIAAFFLVRKGWHRLFAVGLFMTYLAHLIWLFNTPVLGHPLRFVAQHHSNLFYSFVYFVCFACANVMREADSYSDLFELSITTLNGLGFLLLNTLVILRYFASQTSFYFLLVASVFLTVAILRWVYHGSKYASALYACLGYMALSIAIFARFQLPDYFVWLSWQSLLVITTAIWFRSRIIIVVNILIYLGILLAYLQAAASSSVVNLSYALVALISARILNWQKERLTLKTDFIRNAYLASTFFMVLYGLYHAIPEKFVSLSWLGAAIFYFIMSLILHNIKYRWMAILTIFAMLIYVFFVDLAKLGAEYRILLFVATGVILLVVSLIYSRHKRKVLMPKNG